MVWVVGGCGSASTEALLSMRHLCFSTSSIARAKSTSSTEHQRIREWKEEVRQCFPGIEALINLTQCTEPVNSSRSLNSL